MPFRRIQVGVVLSTLVVGLGIGFGVDRAGAEPAARVVSELEVPAPTTTRTPPPPPTVEQIIARWFPDNTDRASDIAWCESRLDPHAVSDTADHGLFQINTVHRQSFADVTGVPWDQGIYDPELNAEFARWLFDRQGWEPWSCHHRV